MESAAQQPGEDDDEPEPFLQLAGAAVAPPDAESDGEDQEVVPIAGANEPDVLTSRDDSAGSAQRADAEAALKAAAALAHPAAEAAKAAAEAMEEDPATEFAEATEAMFPEDRVQAEVPHHTEAPASSSSEPPLPQDLPPSLDTDDTDPSQAPRLRNVSQQSPRPPQPTDAPEETHLPRGTRVFLSGGPESVGAYHGHSGVVQAYHEAAEAYTVQLDSSGPHDLTVLQVSRHNVTAEAEGSPLPPLSLALPVQETLQDSSIGRDPTLQSVGRSSELDTLHSLHINPGSILGRVLLAYCSQVAKRPKRLLFFYILCAVASTWSELRPPHGRSSGFCHGS